MRLGENIYRLRTARGLSQGDLAERLDVSRQSVSKWENGAATPDLDKLVKLCALFEVTLDELVNGETYETAAEGPGPAPEDVSTAETVKAPVWPEVPAVELDPVKTSPGRPEKKPRHLWKAAAAVLVAAAFCGAAALDLSALRGLAGRNRDDPRPSPSVEVDEAGAVESAEVTAIEEGDMILYRGYDNGTAEPRPRVYWLERVPAEDALEPGYFSITEEDSSECFSGEAPAEAEQGSGKGVTFYRSGQP